MPIEKHFVKSYSPGFLLAEDTTQPVQSLADIRTAVALVRKNDPHAYAFQMITRSRGDDELDSKQTFASGMYYLGGEVRSAADVEAENLPSEKILRSNIKCNGYTHVITSPGGNVSPFNPAKDVALPRQ